ncbi:putative DNA helicase ino80 [Recurvomyces mirabilis]|uniref:Chromatin-remodeling ATPase INO80 n=1 Tax=Recurvomyces mirabilis TaxID=574656 RepID=A0AAE1C367_9PEZI|nr:putative DNA helicase ino80 [Recurvomyces mirabilis]KAK5154812.1 putative DNA helicase ino80 [Recurvomyces mirabilis]
MYQSPTQGAAHAAYSPTHDRHGRSRAASYTATDSPSMARLPPPPSPSRDRPTSSYYDPISETRANTRDISAHSTPYHMRSPVQSRFPPDSIPLPPQPHYANDSNMSRPHGQSSPPASSHAHPAQPPLDARSPPMYHPPRTNGTHSHTMSAELPSASIAQPTSVPTRMSNPMSMNNLLSEDTPTAPPPEPTPAKPPTPVEIAPPAPKSTPRKASRNSSASHQGHPRVKEEQLDPLRSRADKVAIPPAHATVIRPPRPQAPIQTGPPGLTIRDTEAAWVEIQAQDMSDLEEEVPGMEPQKQEWHQKSRKRTLELGVTEGMKRKRRRMNLMQKYHEHFNAAAEAERAAYLQAHEDEVAEEVRAKEVEEDKERKKDQQRKRRREKAIADEQIKRDEAFRSLETITDEEERIKVEKDIQRFDKKIRDTQSRLQGITPTKDFRHESPTNGVPSRKDRDVPMEHSFMNSFAAGSHGADEAQTPEFSGAVGKRGGRGGRGGMSGGGRARKSKEQKEAEKARAAGAQAQLDQGQELPLIAPKEEERLQGYARPVPSSARDDSEEPSEMTPVAFETLQPTAGLTGMARFESKGYLQIYEQISRELAKQVPKVARIKNNSLDTKQSNARKTAQLAAKEARRWQLRTNKSTKEVAARAKRAMREMLGFWKRNERDEREGRKVAERAELDKAKKAEAEREANRQKRKLNFLISQTELYSHFIGKKVKTDEIERHGSDPDGTTPSGQTIVGNEDAEHSVDLGDSLGKLGTKVTNFEDLDFDAEDETELKKAAMINAQHAVQEAQDRARAFDRGGEELSGAQESFDEGEMNFQNPTSLQSMDVAQPKMLNCQLKEYQLKGLNWLVNLYEQGINGILADEMGLGKTVQSISVMAYLAEVHDIWGPFLVIAPASTLHNWQQEITRFVPNIKVLPYWGSAKDRKVLRKFWDRKHITYNKDSPFHVLVTSYQLVVADAAYFQKVKWQYMILDEAQAIKSSQSSRWKSLLGFHCRNRLLLTGTPIQNNMQELWALLHFIMPSLFDNHDEFSEWFSKDIENHAQSNTKLNEDQLRRLHMILKPFMLRRVKKHVQKELGDKIEEDVFCDLTYRQRAYYTNLRNKISILDLIEKAAVGDDQDTATLMNLVMQFRKVCNHPDLFERAEIKSPMAMTRYAETASFMREGSFVQVAYSVRSMIEYWLPSMLGEDAGRLDVAGPGNARIGWRKKALATDLSIWDERNVVAGQKDRGAFSWLRFADASAGEVADVARKPLMDRAVELAKKDNHRLGKLKVAFDDDEDEQENQGYIPVHAMLNIVKRNDRKPLAEVTEQGYLSQLMNISQNKIDDQGYGVIEALYLPSAAAPPIELVCPSQQASAEQDTALFDVPFRKALYPMSLSTEAALLDKKLPPSKWPTTGLLPAPEAQKQRFTSIRVPSMRRFVTDSGKLAQLDRLLRQLKEGGHRVLLYFQMTRMIDLMEEYLTYRNYKYCRLDGSTKLEDRRDTVAAFQSSPDLFVFLLSTRAGGLGINLTAADTVIFYDSDWNPTIDSQAMDRAHRLGQTRQVTVYRLITRGTIEERIRKRALQKEEVQRVVISGQAGGDRVVDFNNRSRENNRTKEMAMWLADDDQAALIERREAEVLAEEESKAGANAGGANKKKRKTGPTTGGKKKEVSMDDMYHEGEGTFDDGPSHEPSGAATPVSAMEGPPAKKKKGMSKKAKTVQQRLAVVDGDA